MEWAEARRRAGVVLALSFLGACTGAEAPEPSELELSAIPTVQVQVPPDNLHALMEGLAHSLESAASDMEAGYRRNAMLSLDDAVRVGEVGIHAASGARQAAIHRAAAAAHRARRLVQNGRPEAVAPLLSDAAERLRRDSKAAAAARSVPERPAWHLVEGSERYYGAELINSRGRRIGEVVGFVREGERVSRIVVGLGTRDLFGFWDLPEGRVQIPAEAVVLGPEARVGVTKIALAVPMGSRDLRRASP